MSAPVRVIDVDELGQPALVVTSLGPKLLLVDTALTPEERISILERFFPLAGDPA